MKTQTVQQQTKFGANVFLVAVAFCILVGVYIFQRSNITSQSVLLFGMEATPTVVFIANRVLRLILNDFACFILIYVFFREKKYLKVAFLLFLIELLIILPLYLVVKLSLEGDSEISSPLLSQVHRLIVNPTLMFLLIAGFVYQRFRYKE